MTNLTINHASLSVCFFFLFHRTKPALYSSNWQKCVAPEILQTNQSTNQQTNKKKRRPQHPPTKTRDRSYVSPSKNPQQKHSPRRRERSQRHTSSLASCTYHPTTNDDEIRGRGGRGGFQRMRDLATLFFPPQSNNTLTASDEQFSS